MSAPLEGAPARIELELQQPVDPAGGPRVIAAPGYPVFIQGTRGAVRVEVEEIPDLIEVLRRGAGVAERSFDTRRRPARSVLDDPTPPKRPQTPAPPDGARVELDDGWYERDEGRWRPVEEDVCA